MSLYSILSLQGGRNVSLAGSLSPKVSFIDTELAYDGGPFNANCFLIPSLLYGIIIGVIAYFLCSDIYRNIFPKQNDDDEDEEELFTETVWHNCLETYAVYEYALMFRLGCPSPMFNMNTAWIEVDLMGSTPDGETPIYQPIRLNCKHLKDRICDELSIGIGRITAMPNLTGIRAYHNVPQEYIFLYEYILCDLKTNAIPTWCRVNDYITRRPTIFRGLDSRDEEFGLYPELPEMEWSRTELVTLGSSGMTFLATFLMLMESLDLYMEPFNSQRGSLVRSLFDILYALPLILLLIVGLLAGYKYALKKKALQTDYLMEGHDNNLWKYLLWAFNGMVVALAVGCVSGTFFLSKTTNLTLSIYWWSSCVIVAVIAGGSWLVAEKSIQIRRLMGGFSEGDEGAVYRNEVIHPVEEDFQQLYIEANSVGTEYSKAQELKQKTTNFTMQKEAEIMNSYTGTINVGPKMMAPKSNCKNANNLTLKKKNSASRLAKNSNGAGKVQKKQSKRLSRGGTRRTASKPKCSK